MQFGKKGDWVQIKRILLTPDQRANNLPESTRNLPMIMWVKGFLEQENANIGDCVSILTRSGRVEEGELVEVNPSYRHDFGDCIPELIKVGDQARNLIFGGSDQ